MSAIFFSLLPFLSTWILTTFIAHKRIFPLLSSEPLSKEGLPLHHNASTKATRRWTQPTAKQVARLVFSTSIGLSTVLVELVLCEIVDILHPEARGLALRLTLNLLLILNILVTPALEIHSIVRTLVVGANESMSTSKSRPRLRLVLEVATLAGWLLVFWYIPRASILHNTLHDVHGGGHDSSEHAFKEACLERIGIIGISLMASLSGFAAVSSLWQTFGVRHRTVNENDISRKEAGLLATQEMLSAKQSRLRALKHKIADTSSASARAGLVSKVFGTIRGNPDLQEVKNLEMEISGLETMYFALSQSLSTFRSRRAEQQRSKRTTGRLLNAFGTGFALYCAYRISATSFSSLRRWWQPGHSFATSDPINNILALLTTHWDSNLDRAAWSRQISFLLSGVMLLASFSAVLQTFHLFSRFFPRLVQHTQTSLPLIISQVAGTYVVSSTLLLRSNLPEELSSVVNDALGAPLESRFVDSWFESWFLAAVGVTATGIVIGRKVGGDDGIWDDDDGMDMGSKMS
ncbi:Abscisic acid G-protein coupled receptor-domain-containing protein [Neohortaea acidophila]|uniref:Abscisic acid G-protein coupled receptor-domain-containing protein n=1 Tax=Neohortaea acidophila TaxID=245834 RepID=A0A6A6Q621_9PEZI|nr:Abscisic acid G-protein coupled receptor-domain-containing protein [Neohortaea acidophila]KAF2487888.1 Abscisic acid G-protein coupled receptor-domain-containing protein [Neohortaea acidophila]